MIYLDNNATTPLAPEVISAMVKCLRECVGNPSSSHSFGRKAKENIEIARRQAADLIGASPDEIIFTSGGTEANNIAILGTAKRYKSGHIITSCIEHPSVLNPIKYLQQQGFSVTYLPVNKFGCIDPNALVEHIRKDTILITVMHSNNETGVIQPIEKIGRIAHERDIIFHSDAAQSAGKISVNANKLGLDLLTMVSHKFNGPKGVGTLYSRNGVELKPIMFGASHERGLRPGTENVCSIIGFGSAAELAKKELRVRVRKMNHLSSLLYKDLLVLIPGIKLNGHPAKRLPNTLNISFPNIISSVLLERLKKEIVASTGSACHEGKHKASHVLKAMGQSDKEALSAVRLSLGRDTTEQQIKKAVKAIARAYRGL